MKFEMNAPLPKETVDKDPNVEQVIDLGYRKVKKGDAITVIQAPGVVETDWLLESFGGKFIVAQKVDPAKGVLLSKTIPKDEFIRNMKVSERERIERPVREAMEEARSKGWAQTMTDEKQAIEYGIDMTDQDWREQVRNKSKNSSKNLRELLDGLEKK